MNDVTDAKKLLVGAVALLTVMATLSVSGCLDDSIDWDVIEGFATTKFSVRLTITGRQYTSTDPPDGSGSLDTKYRIGEYTIAAEPVGGIDENGNVVDTPLLYKVTDPSLIDEALFHTPPQGASDSLSVSDYQGFGMGDQFSGSDLMLARGDLAPATQIYFDSDKEVEYRSTREEGSSLFPEEEESRGFAWLESGLNYAEAYLTCAVPVLQFNIYAKNPFTGEVLIERSFSLPVTVKVPFDPLLEAKDYNSSMIATAYIVTPYRFAGEQWLSVSVTGSSVDCRYVLGAPLSSSDVSDLLSSLEASYFLKIVSPLFTFFATILIKAMQFIRLVTTGVAYDTSHDSVNLLNENATLLETQEWIYGSGEGKGPTVFTGVRGGTEVEW